MITMMIAIVCSIIAGVYAGYHWGSKDGYRKKELEEAYDQGQWDHSSRKSLEDCPYELDEQMIKEWMRGWQNADSDGREHQLEMMRDMLDTERSL